VTGDWPWMMKNLQQMKNFLMLWILK
jgi:hypothetical protein